jgi:hypothetical protein
VLKRAKHASIIHLHEIFENDDEIMLVLDLVGGGELFDQIVAMSSYSEASAAKVIRQLTSAIQHLHLKYVVHRDLKPENLLLSEKSDTADVMLADFGLAALVDKMSPLRAAVGTPGYIAPEVLLTLDDPNVTYDYAADIFGIGVIMYILLCGFPPFYAEDDDDLFDLTIEGDYSYPSPFWDGVSSEAKDLIDRMLATDPKKRYTCDQIPQASVAHREEQHGANADGAGAAQAVARAQTLEKGSQRDCRRQEVQFWQELARGRQGGRGRRRRRAGGTGDVERVDERGAGGTDRTGRAADETEEEGDATREADRVDHPHGERCRQVWRVRGIGHEVGRLDGGRCWCVQRRHRSRTNYWARNEDTRRPDTYFLSVGMRRV